MNKTSGSGKTNGKSGRFPTGLSLIKWFLRGSVRWFAASIVFACLASALDLINPKIIGFTVDSVIGNLPPDSEIFLKFTERVGGIEVLRDNLLIISGCVLLVALLSAAVRYAFRVCNARGSQRLVRTMRDDLYSHIASLPFSWHGKHQTGDIIQRCTSDVEVTQNFLSNQLTDLFRTVVLICFALYFMTTISWKLTIVAAAFMPVIVLYSLFFHKRIGDTFYTADVEEGKLSSIAQENLTGVRVVRAFGREKTELDRFSGQNDHYMKFYIHMAKQLSAFWSSGDLATGLQSLLLVVLGTVSCVRGNMTAGNFIAFLSYNGMLTWPVRSLGRIISEMSKAGVSIERIRDIMNADPEADRPGALEGPDEAPLDRDIDFAHVSFTYQTADGAPEVLHDINLHIKAGSTVGILGGTGSGKSTLMYLLDRLYDLPEGAGKITIGGVDIADMKAAWLRRGIGMVLQEPYLFSRTLSENIAITDRKADLRRVKDAAKIASLDHAVSHFTKGYDTFVGERGVTLSGGQKQRAAIAQMILRRPPIMIFDDSLSAVDAETDAKIRKALAEKTAGSTVILVAHRITTLMNADDIVVLDHGRIAEEGTHEELMAKGGIYRRVTELQTAGAEG